MDHRRTRRACAEEQVTAPESIDRWIGELLLDYYTGHWAIPQLQFPQVRECRWQGFDKTGISAHVATVARGLRLDLQGTTSSHYEHFLGQMRVRNQPAELILEDDSRIDARLAVMRHADLGERVSGSADLVDWMWSTSVRAHIWLAKLHGGPRLRAGNLRLSEDSTGSMTWTALRLRGQLDWYMVARESERIIVVVAEPGIQRDAIRADLVCLEWAFGAPLAVDHFVGIDVARQLVGAFGYSDRGIRFRRGRSPVPDEFDDEAIWPPHMFEVLTARVKAIGIKSLLPGIGCYMDAQGAHLDGAYLLGHIGLEATLLKFASLDDQASLVSAKGAWARCIDIVREVVRTHLREESDLDLVLGRMKGAARPPIRQILDRYLLRAGIGLPDEVRKEMAGRNKSAHGFWMSPDRNYDVDIDYRRIEMVLTILAGVIAIEARYQGPIKGYDVRGDGVRPSPAWWPVRSTAETIGRRYSHRRDAPSNGKR